MPSPNIASIGSNIIPSDDLGDFVESEDEAEVEGVSESPNLYPQGLLYPICIGDVIADRYRIDHKLGYGSYSTVWMAYDMVGETDVALKIMVLGEKADCELLIQNKILQRVKDTTHLLLYKHTFLLPSPHGNHRVLVLPLQGPNLRDYPHKRPLATRMSFAVQLLMALKSLHDGGFVHSDINRANIIFSLRSLPKRDATAKYKLYGRPQKMRLFTEQWKKGELVIPMTPDQSLVGDSILLGDFGLTREADILSGYKLQSPAKYCAPERCHDNHSSFASDMWSYMCLFFEFYTTVSLFHGIGYAGVMSSIADALGPLPLAWKGSYLVNGPPDNSWYDPNRQPQHPDTTMEAKLARLRPDISAAERELVLSILRRGLSLLPERRLTATQLLEDTSFKELLMMNGL